MNVWFTSDEHYGHKNIITFCERPFSCIEDMEEGLVERHNAVVRDDDIVWHLGDFAMDARRVAGVLRRLRGRHRLIAGNHDRCHSCHSKAEKAGHRYIEAGFEMVCQEWTQWEFLMNHMPYVEDERHAKAARYGEFRPVDKGAWLLHGHVHGLWKVRDRMINVGVDVWGYQPVSLETLVEMRGCR